MSIAPAPADKEPGGSDMVAFGGPATTRAAVPAVAALETHAVEDASFGRDRAAVLDPAAADAKRNEITIRGPVPYETITADIIGGGRTITDARWEDLLPGEVCKPIRDGITKACKWEKPSPVQRATIAAARIRKDKAGMNTPHIIAQAENGAGKTGAFCLASLVRFGGRKPGEAQHPKVLIIVPKQELSMQAVETIDNLTSFYPPDARPKAVAVLPGHGRGAAAGAAATGAAGAGATADAATGFSPSVPDAGDGRSSMNGATIVATSRGTLDSIMKASSLDISKLGCIVMDEVDELLEESSVRTTLKAIVDRLPVKPLLLGFSATFDPVSLKESSLQYAFLANLLGGAPRDFLSATPATAGPAAAAAAAATAAAAPAAGKYGALPREHWATNRAPAFITVRTLAMPTISHLVWNVGVAGRADPQAAKLAALVSIMGATGLAQTKTLIFCNAKATVHKIVEELAKVHCKATGVTGALDTATRRLVLNDFKRGTTYPTLVATNMLAKGVDIEALRVVIHFDVPLGRSAVGGSAAGKAKGKGKGKGKGKAAGAASGAAGGAGLDQINFVHRSGRVGRGGRHGVVISLVCGAEERDGLTALFGGSEYRYLPLSFERILRGLAGQGITDPAAAALAAVRTLDGKPQGADGEAFVRDVPGAGMLLASKTEAGSRAATGAEVERAVCDTIKDD